MNTKKTLMDIIILYFPIVISLGSLMVAYLAYRNNKNNAKQMFKNMLRENVKKAKHKILELEEKNYSSCERIIVVEIFRDLLFYQGYKDEKKQYLSDKQNDELSKMQEKIEDFISYIFVKQEVLKNKNEAKYSLNDLLHIL